MKAYKILERRTLATIMKIGMLARNFFKFRRLRRASFFTRRLDSCVQKVSRLSLLGCLGCLAFGVQAQAVSEIPTETNPVFEQRLHALVENLRCPVCQNESLASSHAPLAQDLRKTVQLQMEQGKDDQEILVFLKERYGDFIYYQPPLNATTFLLWFGPVILLVGGSLGLFFYLKRRKQ